MSWQNHLDSLRLIQVALFSVYYLGYLTLLVLTPLFYVLRFCYQSLRSVFQSAYTLSLGSSGFYSPGMTTNYLTIEGGQELIYRVEVRNKLDGAKWRFYTNSSDPFRYLLNRYKDNDIVEWRIKSFRAVNMPHTDCEL